MKMFVLALVPIIFGCAPLPVKAANFDHCAELFAKGAPVARAGDNQLEVCHHSGQYAVLYSIPNKAALYCAESLSTASIDRVAMGKRTGENASFHESNQLSPAIASSLSDFKRSGYDRGHLCPYADLGPATNDLLQIVPQAPQMNREPWAKIERDTRKYVRRTLHPVYVITGVVYGDNPKEIGRGVAVPTHFYKLVIDQTNGKSWAHWMENSNTAKVGPTISKEALEAKLGYKLAN